MRKKVLIIEDNVAALEGLKKLINDINSGIETYTTSNIDEAYSIAMRNPIDLFLIDIILDTTSPNDVSGMIFADRIRENDSYKFTPIIFTTSMVDPQLYAFTNIHSYGYLEKPYSKVKAKELIEQALAFEQTEKVKNIYLRKNGVMHSIKSSDIIHVSSKNRKLYVRTKQETMEFPRMTCKEFLEAAHCRSFIPCSRDTIVNKDYIVAIDCVNLYIILEGSYGRLELGGRYKNRVLEAWRE